METDKTPMAFKIRPDIAAKLRAAANNPKDPYAPTMTAIVERGIELALKERQAGASK